MYPDWISELPLVDVDFPGAEGRLISGESGQVVLWKFDKGGSVSAHKHGPQMGIVLCGSVSLTVEGISNTWEKGEVFTIGNQETHSAVLAPGTCVIEIFKERDRHVAR